VITNRTLETKLKIKYSEKAFAKKILGADHKNITKDLTTQNVGIRTVQIKGHPDTNVHTAGIETQS